MLFQCGCGKQFQLRAKNTAVYVYDGQEQYNFFYTECPRCRACHNRFFGGYKPGLMGELLTLGCELVRAAGNEVPDRVRDHYQLMEETRGSGIRENYEPQTVVLTDRLEAEIAKLAADLEGTPDEWIQEIFASPPPKINKPLRWAA